MPPPASLHETTTLIERLIVVGIFAGLVFGAFQILRPFATAILFASALAIATWPLRDWLVRHGVPAGLAATLLLLIMLTVIGIPAVLLAPALGERLVQSADYFRVYFSEAPELPDWLAHFPLLKDRIDQVWSALTRAEGDLYEIIKPYSTELRNLLIKVGHEFAEAVLQFFLSIAIATMFWLRGEALAATLKEITERLAGPVAARALTAAANSVRGIAYGVVGTAVLQAVALTLGTFGGRRSGSKPSGLPGAVDCDEPDRCASDPSLGWSCVVAFQHGTSRMGHLHDHLGPAGFDPRQCCSSLAGELWCGHADYLGVPRGPRGLHRLRISRDIHRAHTIGRVVHVAAGMASDAGKRGPGS